MRFLPAIALFTLTLGACYSSNDVEAGDDGALVLGAVEQTETVERGVVPGTRTLVFDGFSGTITLSGTDDAQALLRFVKKGRGDDNDDARKALEAITLGESGDDASYRYELRTGDAAHTSVDVDGTVPEGTRLEIRLQNGNVVVRQVTAPLTIRVENGAVQVAGAASNVQVSAQNGDLTVALAALPAEATVEATTQNGQIRLGLPADAGARIEATAGVGAIRTDGLDFRSQRLDPEGAGGRFRATMGSGSARVTLSTENGGIELLDAATLTVISAVPR